MRDHDVQEAGHDADRAVAVERGHRRLGQIGLEPHRSAMTAAANDHARSLAERGTKKRARPLLKPRPGAEGLAPIETVYRAAIWIGDPALAAASNCSRCAVTAAIVSARHWRTSFLPARSASEAVPQTSRAARTMRRSSSRWPLALARSRSAVWTMLVTGAGSTAWLAVGAMVAAEAISASAKRAV